MKILLDYGHGGADPGATSGNVLEKNINLVIGQRIAYHLSRHSQKVLETRNNDSNPTLSQRSNQANSNNVDACISIHCNSFSDPTAQGMEIYTYGQGTREIQLAKSVHVEITKAKLYTKDRGIKQANLHMVREPKMAAILIEMAFISNDVDRNMLLTKTEEYAVAITKGILSYWGINYKEESKPTDPGATGSTNTLYKVSVGAYSDINNARKRVAEMKAIGVDAYIILP